MIKRNRIAWTHIDDEAPPRDGRQLLTARLSDDDAWVYRVAFWDDAYGIWCIGTVKSANLRAPLRVQFTYWSDCLTLPEDDD